MLSLFDPPRDDTADTVANAARLGNEVKMITGDHIAIAKETARQLGLGTNIVKPEVFASLAEVGGAIPPHFLTQYGGSQKLFSSHFSKDNIPFSDCFIQGVKCPSLQLPIDAFLNPEL